jgi:hypothetical protein
MESKRVLMVAGGAVVLILMMVEIAVKPISWSRGRLALASHSRPGRIIRAQGQSLPRASRGDALATEAVRLFEFTARFQLPQAPGWLEGLMASDGSRHRIVVYWIEPYIYRESDLFLRWADFIVTPEAAYYWVYDMPKPSTFRLLGDANESLLPRVNSAEAVARSALAVLNRNAGTSLEMGRFFHESREHAYNSLKGLPEEADSNGRAFDTLSDVEILNALPGAREYAKAGRADGVVEWGLRRAVDKAVRGVVTIKSVVPVEKDMLEGTFDPNTLGRWALVPIPYRTYWSFDKACMELTASADKRPAGRQVFEKIGSYLADHQAPAQVCRGLDRLRFKAALETGDSNSVWQAAQAAVAGLCSDRSVDTYQCLLQLGSMSGKIDQLYPQGAEERLRPLVAQAVGHAGADFTRDMNRLIEAIERNRWLTYRKLVLEAVAAQEPSKAQLSQDTPRQEASPDEATK